MCERWSRAGVRGAFGTRRALAAPWEVALITHMSFVRLALLSSIAHACSHCRTDVLAWVVETGSFL